MKPTLLIAEDDVELSDIMQRFLSQQGYDVETTSDGLDCQAKLLRMSPVAVVLDLELRWGGANGVVSWLREERLLPEVPVILTATAGFPFDTVDAGPPVIKVLSKPFPLTALLESVRAAIAQTGNEETFGPQLVTAGPELFHS